MPLTVEIQKEATIPTLKLQSTVHTCYYKYDFKGNLGIQNLVTVLGDYSLYGLNR